MKHSELNPSSLPSLVRAFRILFIILVFIALSGAFLRRPHVTAAPLAADGTMSVSGYYSGFGGNYVYNGMTISITIVDADLNVTFGPGNDTFAGAASPLTVDRVAPAVGPAVPITITESAITPGTFTATFNPVAAPVNGVINETHRINYADPTFTTETLNFSIIATDASLVVSPTSATLGSNFTVTLTDPDRNISAGDDSAQVVIGIRNLTDASPSALFTHLTVTKVQEVSPGVFQLVVNNANPNPEWDVVPSNTGNGDQLQIIYDDQFRAAGGPTVGVTATHTIGVIDGSVQLTPNPVSPNGIVTITVTDGDLNLNGAVAETTSAAIYHTDKINSIGGIILTETGPNTGIFSATFPLNSFNPTPAGPLSVTAPNNTIYAEYGDINNTTLVPVNRKSTTVTIANTLGTILSPTAYINTAITPLVVRVTDADLNTTNAADTVNIRVQRTLGCTDPAPIPNTCTKPVIATETGINTGIFEFSYLDFANLNVTWTPDDEAVDIADTFDFIYTDVATGLGGAVTVTDTTIIIGNGDGSVVMTPEIVAPNGVLEVCVFDADRNLVAGAPNNPAESVQITLGNSTDKILPGPTFSLFENTSEGVFCNQINISNPTWGLSPTIGDTLIASYTDLFPTGGGAPKTFTDTSLVGISGQAATVACTNTIPGRSIEVTVTDPDRTADGSVNATGQNVTLGGTSETLVLNNIGGNAFKGTVSTAAATSADGTVDGILEARANDTMRFSYVDDRNTTGVPVTVTTDCKVVDRRTAVNFCDRGFATTAPTWRAEYFNNKTLQGSPVVVADEVHLSVNWEETAPFREVPSDGWSARWQTTVRVVDAGKYRFRIGVDDGARFWVDNQLFLDQWSNGAFRTFFVDVTLQPGDHTFKVEYFDDQFVAGLVVDCQFGQAPVAAIDSEGNTVEVIPDDVNFEEAVAHITTGRINVRANPTVESPRIGYVYIYERYPILGVTDDNGWYLIQLRNGQTGWVARLYVKRYEENPVQIYPSWSGTQAELPNVEVAGYSKVEMNVRDIPRGDVVVTIIPAGTTFRILARTQSGAWVKISVDGVEGWVYNLPEYVGFSNGSVRDLPREG